MCQKKIKTEFGAYILIHGTKAAVKSFNKNYPKLTFLRTIIKIWKTIFKRKGKPNLLSDNLMAKFKTIMIEILATGTTANRHIVLAIVNGVLKSCNPIMLKENGGSLQP